MQNISVYYIGYVTMKDSDYVKIDSGFTTVFDYWWSRRLHWRKNGNKDLTLISTDKIKERLIKYTKLWDKIKNLFKKLNDKPGDYDEKYMNIKLNLDDNLPLNNLLKIHNMIIVIRSVFQEDGKYYPHIL